MDDFIELRDGCMELTSLELYQEDGQYYLSAKYHYGAPYKESDFLIPKIKFPFPNIDPNIDISWQRDPDSYCRFLDKKCAFLNLNIYALEICENEDGNFFIEENVKEFPQEVTMGEVEKKFGHPVRIVREKSK